MSNRLKFGAKGTKVLTTSTGNFYSIVAVEDSNIDVVTNWTNADATETIDLIAGQVLYGVFTSITLNSGYVVAYE